MSILDPKKSRDKLAGVRLTPRVCNYLTLYSIAKSTPKTKILRKLIDQWVNERSKEDTLQILLDDIIQRAKIRWRVEKASGKGMTLPEFKQSIEDEFHKKEIPEAYIKLILIEINGKD